MGVKAHSRSYMKTVGGKYWKDSTTKEWGDKAKESYERISKQYEIKPAQK